MNRSPFFVAQCAQDLSQNYIGPQCSFSSIVGRLNSGINDKREPVLEAVVNFADEFLNFLNRVLFHDPVPKRFSCQIP